MNYILDHSLSLPHLEIVKLDIKLLFGEGRNLLLGWMLSILHDVSILLVSELAQISNQLEKWSKMKRAFKIKEFMSNPVLRLKNDQSDTDCKKV